ncbi:MAG: family 16 glycosylhydrolase [Ignavibacteriales bacterium]|nr:family 16 glycosylhydrolase [Ignavibacteriales bacterium]
MKTKIIITAIFFFSLQIFSSAQVVLRGAEYRTKDSFMYGRFEASIKAPGKEGMLTSLFTYFDGLPGDDWASSKWNEVDIEIMGRYNNDVQFNTITAGAANHVRHQYVNFNPALDYHTYAFEWTPEYIAWFIDGTEVYRQTGDHVKTVTRAQKLMMNIWCPIYTNWAGVWNDALLPGFGFYDWAAYYKYSPGTGNYGTGNNFTLDWKDEFNSFDDTRWEKGDHGFNGNKSSFIPDNIVFAEGKLILCLTDKSTPGYVDNIKPTMLNVRADSESKIEIFFSEKIEKTSAETIGNYIIPGFTVNNAALLPDKRTIELQVNGLDLNSHPNLIVSGIRDLAVPVNISDLHLRPILITKKFTLPLKINVGGNVYKDFIADNEFITDTSNYGFMEGTKGGPFANEINNTLDDQIYQTEINGLAKYILRIPNGKYKIKLLLAENYYNSPGKRVFDIYIQGNLVINGLDIFKEAGSKAAVEKIIEDVEVKDYLIDIHFAAQIERPLLNGIIIESLEASDVKTGANIPNEFKLEQNYPNPFNPGTSISYRLPNSSFVSLKVFDSLGSEIAVLVNEEQASGNYKVDFNANFKNNGKKFSSGVYFYSLQTDNYFLTKKMLLLK